MFTAEQDAAHAVSKCTGIYVCDLAPGISDTDLWQLMSTWGRIAAFERINHTADEALIVEFDAWESAKEARHTLNFTCIRGKTSRCLLRSDIKTIKSTMLNGNRLYMDNLDPALESRGFSDACCIFGHVLDCKIELDTNGKSCGYGFVHYATLEDAQKATKHLHGMQIGAKEVQVRPFSYEDSKAFTGCHYSTHINRELSANAPAFSMPS
mmetsp:Transcript_45435/g.105388  ORF Transcript_45435/g.105388 Transcript_45435/m.105388 type:complete len:210 (+) Transcript_45435:83-712(+)